MALEEWHALKLHNNLVEQGIEETGLSFIGPLFHTTATGRKSSQFGGQRTWRNGKFWALEGLYGASMQTSQEIPVKLGLG